MLRVIRFAVTAAIVLGVVWLVAHLTGHFALSFGAYTLSTTLPVAILLFAIVIAVILAILGLLRAIFRTPARLSVRRAAIRRDKSEAASLRALSSIAAGDAAAADQHARAALRLGGPAPLALYVSGEAARLAGRHQEAEQHFNALAKHPHAGFLGWRGLIHPAGGLQARDAAQKAALAYPGSVWLRDQRIGFAARDGDYANAARLATEPRSRAALAIMASRQAETPRIAIDWAREAVKRAPDLAPAYVALAEARRRAGRKRAARKTLLRGWRRAPHPDMAAAYLSGIDVPLERAAAAQELAAVNPGHPESVLLLARTAIAADLPGVATRHVKAAAKAGLDAGRLARLRAELAGMGDDPAARQEALQAAMTAPPGPSWRCRTCGATQDHWQANCPRCEATGSLAWSLPPDSAAVDAEFEPRLLATT